MLGKTVLTEADIDTSIDIMYELKDRIKGELLHKRHEPIAKFKDLLTKGNMPYSYLGAKYKISFGKITHRHNIGNNNEIPIYLETLDKTEKCLAGFMFVLLPIYGNYAEAYLKDINGNRLE